MRTLHLLVLLVLLALASECTSGPDRPAELAACQLISHSGDELARCLVMKFSWVAESAGSAKYEWQRRLDSLIRDHEEQVATLIAQQDAERARIDSVRRDAQRREADRQTQRAALEARIDRARNACVDSMMRWWVNTPTGLSYSAYQLRRAAVCDSGYAAARRRAGLPR